MYGRTADTAESRRVQTLPELILPIPDVRPYCPLWMHGRTVG
eukprot:SAG11_NODE_20374_length_446_cov_12.907781_1_plen_41_part_01